MVPVRLLHAGELGEGLFPVGVPVIRARAVEAGVDQYGEILARGHAAGPGHRLRKNLRHHGLAVRAVRIRERFLEFEMVIFLCHDQPGGFSGVAQSLVKVDGLPLELRGFPCAIQQHDRCDYAFKVALRAQLELKVVVEFHVRTSGRQPDRVQVVHAAAQDGAADEVFGEGGVVVLLPVRGQRHGGQVRAGRMADQVDATPVRVQFSGIPVDPDQRPANLVRQRPQAVRGILHPGKIGDDEVGAGLDEHFRREGVLAGEPPSPCATVDEYDNRGVASRCRIDIQAFDRGVAIGMSLRWSDPVPDGFAGERHPRAYMFRMRRIGRLVIDGIQPGLVIVEEYRFAGGRLRGVAIVCSHRRSGSFRWKRNAKMRNTGISRL